MDKTSFKERFTPEKIRAYIGRESIGATKLLIIGYGFSLLAGLYYFFDLFSHFTLQYAIGGLILGPALLAAGHRRWALVALTIGVLSAAESRINMEEPLRFFPEKAPSQYQIVTYNHNYGRGDFAPVEKWLSDAENRFDIVVLQEATPKTVEMAKTLADIYPYQIVEPRNDAFGMVILSRNPYIESEKILLDGPYYTAFAVRLVIRPDNAAPLTIYTLHPHPPTGPTSQAQRDFELLTIAQRIADDQSKNIIMIGDWNITPFAPMFKKLLGISGLHYQAYGLLQNPTWPTFNVLPFLKIPIDHALYSDNLIQLHRKAGPAFRSDHHALITAFAVKDEQKR